jgi:Flp pilus assembly protein TadD
MNKESAALLQAGKTALESKDYKTASLKLREALQLNPGNSEARALKEQADREAFNDVKNMYGESVIEENLGNIESAKKKWRTILTVAPKENPYYEKAMIKMRKYEK